MHKTFIYWMGFYSAVNTSKTPPHARTHAHTTTHTQPPTPTITCNPQKHTKASLSVLKAGARPWVKATVSLLMWSVISSELASLQQNGLQECGKNQCERDERKCVFISVDGAWFPLWSVCWPAPGLSCRRLNRRVTLSTTKSGMMFEHLLKGQGGFALQWNTNRWRKDCL